MCEGAEVGPAASRTSRCGAPRLVLGATGDRFGVHLTLTKRIPARPGSAAARATPRPRSWPSTGSPATPIPRHELLQLAAQLGSDVPFFLTGAPLALAWGRGERLLRLPPLPAAPALLLTPPVPVSTAGGVRLGGRRPGSRPGGVARSRSTSTRSPPGATSAGWRGTTSSRRCSGAIRRCGPAFEALVGTRPLVCRMSGSGSALFAVYRSERDREDAQMMLGRKHGTLTPVRTLATPPTGPDAL